MSTKGCATCAHRLRRNTCGEPVAAGLAPHFCIRFCSQVPDGGAKCPAWAEIKTRNEPCSH